MLVTVAIERRKRCCYSTLNSSLIRLLSKSVRYQVGSVDSVAYVTNTVYIDSLRLLSSLIRHSEVEMTVDSPNGWTDTLLYKGKTLFFFSKGIRYRKEEQMITGILFGIQIHIRFFGGTSKSINSTRFLLAF